MTITYCPTSGKVCYDERTDAERALKAIQRRPGHKRVGAGIYRCEFDDCNAWHISQSIGLVHHMKKAERRRKA